MTALPNDETDLISATFTTLYHDFNDPRYEIAACYFAPGQIVLEVATDISVFLAFLAGQIAIDILYVIPLIAGVITTGLYLLALIPCYLQGAPNTSIAAAELVTNTIEFFTTEANPFQTIADNFTSDVRHMVAQVVQSWGLAGRGVRNGYNTGQEWGRIIAALSVPAPAPDAFSQ